MRVPRRSVSCLRGGHLAALLVALAAWPGALAGQAHAGQYVLDACRHADGSPAPTDGWDDEINPPPASVVTRTCAQGAAVTASMWGYGAAAHSGVWLGLLFQTRNAYLVPRRATIWSWSVLPYAGPGATWHSTVSAGDASTIGDGWTERSADGPATIGDPAVPLAPGNRVEVPAEHLASALDVLALRISCGGLASTCPGDGSVALTRAAVTIEDTAGPKFTAPSSIAEQLSAGAALTGVVQIKVAGTDDGAGLYRAALIVDGRELPTATFGDNGGRCVVAPGTDRAFSWREPCARSATAQVPWDTATVADGSHVVAVVIEDASGNSATSAAVTATTRNHATVGATSPIWVRGAENGAPSDDAAHLSVVWPSTAHPASSRSADRRRCGASAQFRTKHPALCDGHPATATLDARFDQSVSDVLQGGLATSAGEPISGATVEAYTRASAAGAVEVSIGTSTTQADGSFRFTVPRRDGSLEVGVRYRARLEDTVPAVEARASRVVGASTTLNAPPRVGRGAHVTFSGQLGGRAGRLDGVPVTLEVRASGRWLTFATAQTGANGAWSRRIRFARTPARYPVRARLGTSVGYPYARSVGAAVMVRVG